jgi:hypothetical protein
MMASASFAPGLAPTVRSRAVARLQDYDRPRSLVCGDKLKWTRIRSDMWKRPAFFPKALDLLCRKGVYHFKDKVCRWEERSWFWLVNIAARR